MPRMQRHGLASRPCYDIVAQAMSGMMSVTGFADGPPCKIGPSIADYVLDKSRLSIRFIPPYSEERKAAASAYAKEHGFQVVGAEEKIA